MKKYLLAAAILALALGAAVYVSESPPERLRTVTGPLSARECASWREQAERFERRQAGWLAVYEGFALLQGVCLPQDAARGRALIEGAFAAGLDEMLVIPYVEALAAIGDTASGAQWLFLAITANQLHLERTDRFYSERDFHMRLALDPRARVGSSVEQWNIWYPRVRAVLDRPPILPAVESAFLARTIRDLVRIRRTEAYLLLDDVERSGRILGVPADRQDSAIALALICGNPEALRRKARYFLADVLTWSFGPWIVGEIAWLDGRTGADGELLAAVLDKVGWRRDDPRIGEEAAFRERAIRDRCAGGETPIERTAPRQSKP